jgi:hypothetical protein
MMIDWAEGHHTMRDLLKDLYNTMLANDTDEAREICDEIVVIARLTKAQIGVQGEKNV